MEPTRRDWIAEAVTTPENHAAWEEKFTSATGGGMLVTLEVDSPPAISTCPECRTLFETGSECPGCFPGVPTPDES